MGRTRVRPPKLTRKPSRLERDTNTEANLPRRLVLRRVAGKQARGRQPEIRIRPGAERNLRPVVVVENRLLVEDVEDVGQDRHAARPADCQVVRGLEIYLALHRRTRLEAVDRLNPRSARGRRNLTTVLIVR